MSNARLIPGDIARRLARLVDRLVIELLPGGRREGHEWRAGSVRGEAGHSLGVHLAGQKAGIWSDFATGERGDALDLVRACLELNMGDALKWSRRWLGIEDGVADLPPRPEPIARRAEPKPDPERWRYPWRSARPIAGTLAATYLAARRLAFDDPKGRVLRFTARRARRSPSGGLEYHPAMLAALSAARTGAQVGIANIFLEADGSDRLRDKKAKTSTGRASGAVVMLSVFGEPTIGLVVCEGVETGIRIYQSGLRPVWACGGAGNLASFPLLAAIQVLTIAADQDTPGRHAAEKLAERWRVAGREVVIVSPPAGDWADP
jgi:hypothetical protein